MIIKQLETRYGIKGKTAVHRQAWKEAYVGLVNRYLRECRDSNISFGAVQTPCVCEPVGMEHCVPTESTIVRKTGI